MGVLHIIIACNPFHFLDRHVDCFSTLDVRGIVSECGQCPSQQSESASDERKSRAGEQDALAAGPCGDRGAHWLGAIQ